MALCVAFVSASLACTNPPRSPGRAYAAVSNPMRDNVAFVGRFKTAVVPPLGILYSHVKAPAFANAVDASFGTKRGEATMYAIGLPPIPSIAPAIDLVTWGDGSEKKAAEDGGITNVTYVDYEARVVLMFFRQLKIVAYGD